MIARWVGGPDDGKHVDIPDGVYVVRVPGRGMQDREIECPVVFAGGEWLVLHRIEHSAGDQ
jgi:hypothetical protein